MSTAPLRFVIAMVMAFFVMSFASAASAADTSAAAPKETKLQWHISKDGKAIVDQNGKEIAHFVKDIRIKTPAVTKAGETQEMKGCMRCVPECVIYEGSRCVQWIRSCTWDFDC